MVTTPALLGQSRRPSAAEVLPGQENTPHGSKAGKQPRKGASVSRVVQKAEKHRLPR